MQTTDLLKTLHLFWTKNLKGSPSLESLVERLRLQCFNEDFLYLAVYFFSLFNKQIVVEMVSPIR